MLDDYGSGDSLGREENGERDYFFEGKGGEVEREGWSEDVVRGRDCVDYASFWSDVDFGVDSTDDDFTPPTEQVFVGDARVDVVTKGQGTSDGVTDTGADRDCGDVGWREDVGSGVHPVG